MIKLRILRRDAYPGISRWALHLMNEAEGDETKEEETM